MKPARTILILISMLTFAMTAKAQEFVPPKPPPLDPTTDFEEMDDDLIEMGDEGFRPPPPPPPPPGPVSDMPRDMGGATGTAFGSTSGKLKFKIVEGQFWEKGKKRGRGPKMR